jgi:hypothetical protein
LSWLGVVLQSLHIQNKLGSAYDSDRNCGNSNLFVA